MTPQEMELKDILCQNCFAHMSNWTYGKTAIPFVPCTNCVAPLGEWLKKKGIDVRERSGPRIDAGNPFPHPEGRQWHPQAVPFSHLALLVLSDTDQSNAWKDDIVYYLKWWASQKENLDREGIRLNHFIEGLKSLIKSLES